jgi:tetratricopeptide (TPR) repeat protein
MSIVEDTGQTGSITDWEAFDLFTDRNEHIRRFLDYLYSDQPLKTILFFHGDGGNGKSWLLRFLSEYCCKRLPDNLRDARPTLTYDALLRFFKEDKTAQEFPHAHLDFGMKPVDDNRPQEPARALLMLRRQLSKYGLRFPLYDYATLLYLHKTIGLTKDRIKNLFPSEEASALTTLLDLFNDSSVGKITKLGFDLVRKHLLKGMDKQATLLWQKLNLTPANVEAIERMDPNLELVHHLPVLFAKDLNYAMGFQSTPDRVVLFFDTHEAFWGSERSLSSSERSERDAWVRTLLANLDLSSGLVAVVGGRDKPAWSHTTTARIDDKYVELREITHFSEKDANDLLVRAEVDDPALRAAIVAYASVGPNEVHPFYLGLCADVVRAAARQHETLSAQDFPTTKSEQLAGKGQSLVERLLKYTNTHIEYAVRALAACRAFNYDIYKMLGKSLDFQVTPPDFDILTAFSFVWRTRQRGDGWFRIHDLLRKLYRENHDELTLKAHAALENYHRDRASNDEATAIAEAIYHTNRLDWRRGITTWNEVFEAALRLSRHTICNALLEVRPELSIETDFMLGMTSANEGDYYARLARHKEARQEYLEAIVAYNKELVRAPDYVKAHNNKGNALATLGDLQARLSQHTEALTSYEQAVASYQEALMRAPDLVEAHNNKGAALQRLGDLQASLSQHTEALTSYEQAVASFQEALMRTPDYVEAHNNKGIALATLGNLQASLSQHTEALTSYEQAVASFQEALMRAPDYIAAHNNKGAALQSLGDLQASLSQHTEALTSYEQAVASFQEALMRAPDYIAAHNNKGAALQSLGDLQASLSQHTEALTSYQQAVASYQEALMRAPDYVKAHNNKGIALATLGNLQASLSQHTEALTSYQQAVASFQEALMRAPDYVEAHSNKGAALKKMADLRSSIGQFNEALENYEHALASYDKALDLAPNFIAAHNNKCLGLINKGILHSQLGAIPEGCISFHLAVTHFTRALEISPNDPSASRIKSRIEELIAQLCTP